MEKLELELEQLQDLRLELETKIKNIQYNIDNFELNESDYEEEYCNLLDEEDVLVCGITFRPSQILKELDPTAYNVGLTDYVDGVDFYYNSDYIDLENELQDIENELQDIENKIEAIEEQISNLEEEEE